MTNILAINLKNGLLEKHELWRKKERGFEDYSSVWLGGKGCRLFCTHTPPALLTRRSILAVMRRPPAAHRRCDPPRFDTALFYHPWAASSQSSHSAHPGRSSTPDLWIHRRQKPLSHHWCH